MNRSEKAILAVTLVVVVLVVVLDAIAPREINWKESYTRYTTDPYACGLVYDRLGDIFHEGITTVRVPIYSTAEARIALGPAAPRVNHLFINDGFRPDSVDAQQLLAMVAQGDNAFITGEYFNDDITEALHFHTAYNWQMADSLNVPKDLATSFQASPATLRFTAWPLRQDSAFTFARGGMYSHLIPNQNDSAQVLAVNARERCVLLRIQYGKGAFYLCSVPKAFTDYYLLKEGSRGFMEDALSLLPDRPVLWDEYYKVGRGESQTPLRFILSRPALKAAYWITILLLALYVFVFAKRRQRAIPEVAPSRNTSREFAETMGRLYYFNGDHADLAHKLIAQFKDEVRRKLRLPRSTWDTETLQDIAKRTAIAQGELEHGKRLMDHYAEATRVSEEQLMTLNKTLDRLRNRI